MLIINDPSASTKPVTKLGSNLLANVPQEENLLVVKVNNGQEDGETK